MTDKKTIDQILEDNAELQSAFERVNVSDDLQPSVDLDALILNMAAEEVSLNSTTSEQTSNVTDITDISFRRGQRESHKALKKKSIFPKWVMSLGMAATVLLSFGVVNKVLLSPEFDSLTKQSSYQTSSDAVSEPMIDLEESELEARSRVEENLAASQVSRARIVDEFNDDVSKRHQEFIELKELLEVSKEPLEAESVVDGSGSITGKDELVVTESYGYDRAAGFARESESVNKPGYFSFEEASPIPAPAPVVQSAPKVSSKKFSSKSKVDESLSADSGIVNRVDEFAPEQVQSRAPVDSDLEFSLKTESLEEIMVTGVRAKTNIDQTYLSTVLFEHKECLVNEDCSLLTLECDSCDCLQAVNREHLDKYWSEFSEDDIGKQCVNTKVECVRNYCQAQDAE